MYGIKGIPDAENYPGGRAGAISWIDTDDNLWLFGGLSYGESGDSGYLNDLWKFDGVYWTWMSGAKTDFIKGIYGIKGVPDVANHPGSRSSATSWIDSNDNLWLFGGNGNGESGEARDLNDLWKFDGMNWTWISGNKTVDLNGVYGTKGVPDPKNYPGSRSEAISWIDTDDNLWLFGGCGYPELGGWRHLNDLWKFDGESWTWISGNKTADLNGVYGTKGIPDNKNYPGSRREAISWIDSDDNLWLFGGYGYAEWGGIDELNDLWKFDGMNWTWVSGNKTFDVYGVYGMKGISDTENYPGSRYDAVSWIDSDDKLWLFGGQGYSESGRVDELNDLWKFDGMNWTWMSGDNTVHARGYYGTKGVPNVGNHPGSRYDAVSWIDSDDKLWLFGGLGYGIPGLRTYPGLLNDLWKYDPSLVNNGV